MVQLKRLATFVRAGEWWTYKLGPILGSAYATATILDRSLISLWPTFLFLLVALILDATFASIINNICDVEEDHISGKTNYMIGRSAWFIALTLLASIAPGVVVTGLLWQSPVALVIYVSNWLIFALYSIPPIRLKQRAFLGILAIALGESLLPHLFSVFLIANQAHSTVPASWVTLIALWSFTAGLRSILWHQIKDFENDSQAGVNTFAVATSPETLERLGRWLVFPIEVVAFLGILWLFHAPVVWGLLAIYLITEYLRYFFWKTNIVIVKPYPNDRLALFEYYDIFYPFASIYLGVTRDPRNLVFLVIYLMLYSSRLGWWWRDIYTLLRWEVPRYLHRSNG